MKVYTAQSGGVLRIKLCGEMDEYSAPSVRAECDAMIDANPAAKKIVIDLAEVAFMDSTGIGVLIGRYKKMKDKNIPIYICNPSSHAEKIFKMTGLYEIMPKIV